MPRDTESEKLKQPCPGALLMLQHTDGCPNGGVTSMNGRGLGTWEKAALPALPPSPPLPQPCCLLNTSHFLLSAVFWSLRESNPEANFRFQIQCSP